MAKISNSTVLSPNDYAGENENFYSLLAVLTSLFNDIGNGFKNNLTFDENIDSELIEYEFTDLVPATLKVKTKFRKTEIISVNAESEIVVGLFGSFFLAGIVLGSVTVTRIGDVYGRR